MFSSFSGQSSPPPDFETAFRSAKLISLIFAAAVFMYLLLAWLLHSLVLEPGHGLVDLPQDLFNMIVVAALLASLGVAVLVLFILPQRDSVENILNRANVATLQDLAAAMLQAHSVRAALAEAPAIFGLVLFLLNGALLPLAALVAFSWAVQALTFPRWPDWEEARNRGRARGLQ